MRPLWKDVLAALWLGMILPGIVLNGIVLNQNRRQKQPVQPLETETVPVSAQRVPVLEKDGFLQEWDLDAYLTCVLLAEMPAQFHREALKAQAVAARTYTWKAFTTGGKHGNGRVCTDQSCCQAFVSEEAYLSGGGTTVNMEKVRDAVRETSPFVLSYEGQLIEATYFSSSSGSTEEALAVWGTDYPYLKAVSSPEEIRMDIVTFSEEEFASVLDISPSGSPLEWVGAVSYTEGGGIETMEICGKVFTGVQLRSLLGLRSTVFQIHPEEDCIHIRTKGYGHRVGMSQYGANAMAEAGCSWQKILQHYYPGTNIVPAF